MIAKVLPREIALRQKQYEYYRDKLLNFPPIPLLWRDGRRSLTGW